MNPIKVVHLITLLELGGAQGNTLHTVRHLDRNEFDVELWCGQGAYWDKAVNEDEWLSKKRTFIRTLVRPINPLFDLFAVIEIWIKLRRLKPVVLHTHSSKAGIIGRLAGKLAKIPIVVHTFHGFGFNREQRFWTRWMFIFLERLCAHFSSKLIFVSQSNLDEASALRIGHQSQYELIRSGVSLELIRKEYNRAAGDQIRISLGLDKFSKIVTTISAFKPQKNLFDFLEMAASISHLAANVEFLVVGDGELRKQLHDWTQMRGLSQKVHFLGWRPDISKILSVTDVFVLTSLWEGLPRALVEAMSVGIPSVCYATDGVNDLLPLGGGFVVTPKNRSELSQKVLLLLKNDDLYRQESQKARTLIGSDFDINDMVHKQENLYRSLDNNRRIN